MGKRAKRRQLKRWERVHLRGSLGISQVKQRAKGHRFVLCDRLENLFRDLAAQERSYLAAEEMDLAFELAAGGEG